MLSVNNTLRLKAEDMADQLVQWRRKLHRNPELSFQEEETSRFVVEMLEEIPGMRVQKGVGYPTAVVGTLSSGTGPTIAIRADMDALPIQEENDVDYKSQNSGVMHACGHDAHTSIALGAATILAESFQDNEIQGTVKFLFQPAEERADEHGSTGAPYMIEGGALADVDGAIALHLSPENPLGEVQIHDGFSMANVDVFKAKITASGGHGAYPHLGTDPVWMLGPVLQALYGITARRVSPLEAAVVSVGKINSGFASNVIPSEVAIEGTIRTYYPDVRTVVHTELKKAFSVVEPLGGGYELDILPEDPALRNDAAMNRVIRGVIDDLYPDYVQLNTPFGLGGEDFANMTQVVPGAMFFLGCAPADGEVRNLHTPNFDIDERVLPVGVAVLAETAKRFLTEQDNA